MPHYEFKDEQCFHLEIPQLFDRFEVTPHEVRLSSSLSEPRLASNCRLARLSRV